MRAVLFDTEVNSLESMEVIELAYCHVDIVEGEFVQDEIFKERFRPVGPFEAGSVAIHGILPEDVESSRPSTEAALPDTEFIIAHNVDFDARVIGDETSRRICTLAICRKLWHEFKSHTLAAMFLELQGMNRQNLYALREAHSADNDVVFLAAILKKIIEKTSIRSMPELYEFSEQARIPEFMTFGKHYGMRIADLDTGYVQWFLRQTDIDPYLRKAFIQRLG